MLDQYARTELLFGPEAMEKLRLSRVAVFGAGGVGGAALEALARSGVGALDIIDDDRVSLTNLNRQILATRDTVGRYKAEAAAERVAAIDPECRVTVHRTFFTPETADTFDFAAFDYVIDAIDTVTGKLELAVRSRDAGTPVISAMGAGNKVDPTAFRVADIYETSVCPLARVMRRELKKRGVDRLKVVYSREKPLRPLGEIPAEERDPGAGRRDVPGSTAFVPPVVGLILAGEVVKDLIGFNRGDR